MTMQKMSNCFSALDILYCFLEPCWGKKGPGLEKVSRVILSYFLQVFVNYCSWFLTTSLFRQLVQACSLTALLRFSEDNFIKVRELSIFSCSERTWFLGRFCTARSYLLPRFLWVLRTYQEQSSWLKWLTPLPSPFTFRISELRNITCKDSRS